MSDHHVVWKIDIEADSPREAAVIARNIQKDPGSYATIFEVTENSPNQTTHVIDLDIQEVEP